MYIILAYDVNQKRVGKVLKICRKYLVHTQKSVFEGSITESKLKKLKEEIKRTINCETDSICIYTMLSCSNMAKENIGVTEEHSAII